MIPAEVRQILAELELVSAGTTYSWGSSGGGKAGSRPPVSGEDDPPHLKYRRDYLRASTDHARKVVQDAALTHLRRLQGRYERPQAQGETPKQWKARLLREGEGFEAEIVARQFNTTPKIVRFARVEFNRFPGDGRPMGQVDSVAVRDSRIRVMAQQGATIAQIAKHFDLPNTTVWEISRRAA